MGPSRKTIGLAGLAALILMFASAEVMAQGWGRGRGQAYGRGYGRGWGRGAAVASTAPAALGLSAEQATKIDASQAAYFKRAIDLEAKLDLKRLEKQRLMLAEKIDRKAIRAKDAELEALRQQMRSARLEHRMDVLEVLTPEQRAEWMNRPGWAGRGWGRGDGWGQGRGRGMGAGPGCGWGRGRGRGWGRGGW